jgi:hypothetical protein
VTHPGDPVIVTGSAGRDLADVLIVRPHPRPVERCARLLTRHPGLALVLIPHGPHTVAVFRDGTVLLHRGPSTEDLAAGLYRWWVSGWCVRRRRTTGACAEPSASNVSNANR